MVCDRFFRSNLAKVSLNLAVRFRLTFVFMEGSKLALTERDVLFLDFFDIAVFSTFSVEPFVFGFDFSRLFALLNRAIRDFLPFLLRSGETEELFLSDVSPEKKEFLLDFLFTEEEELSGSDTFDAGHIESVVL